MLEKGTFILKHHLEHHQEVKLGDVKIRFETHRKHQTCFRRQVGEAVAIKLSGSNPKCINIKNKFEHTRCILPDIGALEPEEVEKKKSEAQEKVIEKLREAAKKLPSRTIPGTRKRDFPDATPRELLNTEVTTKKRKTEERGEMVERS